MFNKQAVKREDRKSLALLNICIILLGISIKQPVYITVSKNTGFNDLLSSSHF
ncbi:MAG: hypothetical protein ACJAV1_000775 [Paraglaciecola sp.]|jgi:hypothetical protein